MARPLVEKLPLLEVKFEGPVLPSVFLPAIVAKGPKYPLLFLYNLEFRIPIRFSIKTNRIKQITCFINN